MYNNMDHVVVAGDLNVRIGNQAIENFIGLFGVVIYTGNGIRLREFANAN